MGLQDEVMGESLEDSAQDKIMVDFSVVVEAQGVVMGGPFFFFFFLRWSS